MSWVSKSWKKAKKWVGKHSRELQGAMTFGASELGRELSGYNQMKQMEQIADEQARVQQRQLELAQRQAYNEAGNQINTSNAGTQEALAKILAKKSALQRSIRTGGQQRLGD